MLERHSPYSQFIAATEQLSELIIEQKLFEKKDEYDKAMDVQEKIDTLKEQLKKRFKS